MFEVLMQIKTCILVNRLLLFIITATILHQNLTKTL